MQELRVRGSYLHHKEIKAAQGIKIAAPGLESAVAGTQMLVVQKGDSIQDLKAEVMGDMTDIFKSVDKTGELFVGTPKQASWQYNSSEQSLSSDVAMYSVPAKVSLIVRIKVGHVLLQPG